MPRNSPKFQSFQEVESIHEIQNVLTIQFEQGFQHVRRFKNQCMQIQISRIPEPDFFSYALVPQDAYPMNWEEEDNTLEIIANGTFFLDTETGQWQWHQLNEMLLESETGLGFGFLGEETIATFHLNKGQNFFGLGEKTGGLNRVGSSFTNWNTDAFAYHDGRDPLYVSIPLYLSVHQGICYGILVDNTCKTRFNFGASNKRMVQISAAMSPMNLIFLPGPTPENVLKHYHELTGTMPLPPKWALGLQQCRYSYYPEHELMTVARNFRSRNIPCDVLYLDIHYMDGYKVFTSDKTRFPDLKKMCEELNEMGFRVIPIQDPGVKTEKGYDPYEDGRANNVFVRYPDGEHWIAGVWPGDCVFPDFTDPKARRWWTEKTANWVSESGVHGLWNDMNEPATWGQDVPDMLEFSMEGRGGSHLEAHNVYGQLMAESSRNGLLQCRPEERPFILTRAGYAGIHRTAAVWSGDNIASEEHYFLGIRLVLSMAMSGVAFSGPDVGGFVGDAGRNLFVRWISVASFFPFFRLHSMIDSRDNEPWSYGELAEAIAGNYIRLRYKLLPTLYSSFKKSSLTGTPILKPYFWEKPFLEFETAYQHQFFWCDQLLVIPAPSDQPAVKADLPSGEWFHLLTGEKIVGGKPAWLASDIDTLPVLVRSGSILITRNPGTHSMDPVIEEFQIHLFYGQGNSNLYVYDDDGLSISPSHEAYKEANVKFNFSSLQLEIETISGNKKLGFTSIYLWHFPANAVVEFNNQKVHAEKGTWNWLEPLPNFDPFEDKGKTYYNTCQIIHLLS
jgi:alpha-glucosidase